MTRNPLRGRLRAPRPLTLVLLVVAFVLGLLLRGGGGGGETAPVDGHDHAAAAEVWTCSMHPQIRQPGPGQCPLCGMDLIPVSAEKSESGNPRELKLSPHAAKLAEIRTAPVERRYVAAERRMVGTVDFDETRVKRIAAWVPGRLDRLFVDFTGIRVAEGDHLVELYSPELISAQEELLQAIRAAEALGAGAGEATRRSVRETVKAAREKLALLGLAESQIGALESRGEPQTHVTILAPTGGIVIEKHAVEGAYVQTGTPIYSIADLSRVWVRLDAYESDLPWLRYGQEVEFRTDAQPGRTFTGRVSFIDPVLDPKTRTVHVRLIAENPDGRLKPGVFVNAVLEARLTEGGEVYDADLAGKWISPMHPEVIKDGPGVCDVCGMDLVPTESLGYVSGEPGAASPPLVIPATAPLLTGKRAVVYVRDPDREGVYEGREVVLGPRAGDWYLVEEGLAEGERVVVNGAFKIDSALQILARPSMMSPAGGGSTPGHAHGGRAAAPAGDEAAPVNAPAAFVAQLDGLYEAYLEIQRALSHDEPAAARAAAGQLLAALAAPDMAALDPDAHAAWMASRDAARAAARAVAAAAAIETARASFDELSTAIAGIARRFGHAGEGPLFVYHCPMAFDNRGADWLQRTKGTENPYFGSTMFKCGSLTAELPAGSAAAEGAAHD